MSKPHWIPFYANDFLSSSKIALLTTEEIGAYVLLLCHAWQDPQCSLPDDDEALSKLGRIKGDMTNLRECFIVKKHRLINERLYKEWEIVKEKSALAKQSASLRWDNKRNAFALRTQCSSQSQSESQLEKKEKKETPLRATVNEVWLTQLKANPAYQHIDLTMQFGKMDAWLAKPGNEKRKKTPTFILNWLNKIEAPITTPGATPCQARITDGRFLKPCGRPSTAGTHTSARCDQHGGTHDR